MKTRQSKDRSGQSSKSRSSSSPFISKKGSSLLSDSHDNETPFIAPSVQGSELSASNAEAQEEQVASGNQEEVKEESMEAQEEQVASGDQEKEEEVASGNQEEVQEESMEAMEEQVTAKDQEPVTGTSSTPAQGATPTQAAPPTPAAPPAVSIGHVDSTTSPAGMPDRIPPRVHTDVGVTVSGYTAGAANVTFSVEGANATNGNATINGAATASQNSNGILRLVGTTQTAPGSAGNLKIVAKQGSTVLARSNSFSVSAIPQNFSVSFNSLIKTGTRWGIKVNNNWQSDSGNVADLNQAERSESVSYPTQTGVFSKVAMTAHNSGYNAGHTPPRQDSHTLGPVATLKGLKGNGSIVANQVFILWDKRTGAKDIPVNNSGFQITKALSFTAATNTTTLTTTKAGASVTANGNTSSAGAGSVSRPIVL